MEAAFQTVEMIAKLERTETGKKRVHKDVPISTKGAGSSKKEDRVFHSFINVSIKSLVIFFYPYPLAYLRSTYATPPLSYTQAEGCL